MNFDLLPVKNDLVSIINFILVEHELVVRISGQDESEVKYFNLRVRVQQ